MSTGYYHVGLLADGYVLINPEDKIISEPSADKRALALLAASLNEAPELPSGLPVVAQVQTALGMRIKKIIVEYADGSKQEAQAYGDGQFACEMFSSEGGLMSAGDSSAKELGLSILKELDQPLKLWRAKTKTVVGLAVPADYIDWYHAATQEEARELWLEDAHRYGVPLHKTTVELVECDEQTLKPIGK